MNVTGSATSQHLETAVGDGPELARAGPSCPSARAPLLILSAEKDPPLASCLLGRQRRGDVEGPRQDRAQGHGTCRRAQGWHGRTPALGGAARSSPAHARRPEGSGALPEATRLRRKPWPAYGPFVTTSLKRPVGAALQESKRERLLFGDAEVVPPALEEVSLKPWVTGDTVGVRTPHHGTGSWRAWAEALCSCVMGRGGGAWLQNSYVASARSSQRV